MEAAFREGRKLESPDSVENCVSLWSGASDKDVTVCPVKGRAYGVYVKSCPVFIGNKGGTAIYSSLTEKSVRDFYICI